ncbi:Sec-independent protein translocase protein TatA [Candidatus Hydrogenisulfobacillus filiaventi]|uniref:Sec-independent protein translocase protein TatA n=1 Tax=Candidatus Hydrogenisulfobacillus filiaventi TaxID=2707344 RepID=A0A6F8ZFL4_9FIRM|nr:twin-arginine translocase TatA/TatE family subunit [Bacillota bacterium]CAB1128252.1 Sec-independent protein translocase protein TatA [Candidatus Hydrogenisulfobacillus filiaventi]
MDIFSPVHIIILLVVALLIFGPKRLPEIGAGLGKSFREFKNAVNPNTYNPEPPSPPQPPVRPQEFDTTAVVKDQEPRP